MEYQVTHAKITKLIAELRSWEDAQDIDERPTMNVLAEKYGLPVEAVRKVAEAEGVDVKWVDPNASTLDLDPEEIEQALLKPDPSPTYVNEDEDTGIWRKKPTGEWERIPPGYTTEDDTYED